MAIRGLFSVYHMMTSCLLVYALNTGPVRDTVNGKVQGITKYFPRGYVDFFYGIPFARPPIGHLRFENPVEPLNWTYTLRATKLPKTCLQTDGNPFYVHEHRREVKDFGEDCLYLNVFQPRTTSTKLAVLLFIHGGSNIVGGGLMFDGGYLASYGDIIVVTMNYRLGALGFLGTGLPEFPGNYGMMDQIMSMKWVKNNIVFFNGDPDKVTILGHSAGGFDVGLHLLSPLSKGLFRAAISQSGPPTSPLAWKHPRQDPAEEVRNISRTLGCSRNTLVGMKRCLTHVDAHLLMRLQYEVLDTYAYPAIVDGHFLPDDPLTLLRQKDFSAANYVIGVTSAEGDGFAKDWPDFPLMKMVLEAYKVIPSDVDLTEILEFEYTNWKTRGQKYSKVLSVSKLLADGIMVVDTVRTADLVSDAGVNVYMYEWDVAPDRGVQFLPWTRVPHGIDLFYLFGSPLSGHPEYTFTQVDRDMSRYMMDSWSNYVKTGVLGPSKGTPRSRTYDRTNRAYQRFSTRHGQPAMSVRSNLEPRSVYFWLTYLPSQIDTLRQCKLHVHPPIGPRRHVQTELFA